MKGKLAFIIPGVIIIAVLTGILISASINKNIEVDGAFAYSLNEDGKSYSVGLAKKDAYFGTELVVPSSFKGKPVTVIKESGFSYCSGFSRIVIPDSISEIGYEAFKNCSALSEVLFADSMVLNKIGNGAFNNCDSLSEIKIPTGMKYLPYNLFHGCDKLRAVELPDGIEEISNGAFGYCIALESLDVPYTVKKISDNAFYNCRDLKSLSFISGEKSSLLRRIGRGAFYGCKSLGDVVFPEKIKEIGSSAFAYCTGLQSVSFTGSSLNEIGTSAFIGCDSLNKVDVADIANWCGVSFVGNDYANPIYLGQRLYNNGELVLRLEIPYGVKTISARAFKNATRIVSVTLPRDFDYESGAIGEDAFRFCYKLAEIHNFSKLQLTTDGSSLPSTGYISAYAQHIYFWESTSYPKTGSPFPYGEAGTVYPEEESHKWATNIYTYGDNDEFIFYKSSTAHYLLEYLGTDRHIALPTTTRSYSIFTGAFFGQTGIESIYIPDCVEEIWHFVFYSSADLKRIYIPSSVISMGDRIFGKTDDLQIYFEAAEHIVGWKESYKDGATDVTIQYSQNKEKLPWVMDLIED